MIVLDTNIVLDIFVFNDSVIQPLKQALLTGNQHWLATVAMRDELERALAYPKISQQLGKYQLSAAGVLAQFEQHAHIVGVPPGPAPVTCSDPDDQKFVDLAVAYRADLFSKDHALLALAPPLAGLGVKVRSMMAL